MPYTWSDPEVVLQFFAEREFTHPELMDPDFLGDLDKLRMRCGFPLTITNDARSQQDLERIYAEEIAKGHFDHVVDKYRKAWETAVKA